MDNFNKRRAGRGGVTGRGRGGSSQRTVKGSTSGRGNVKAVLNEFHIPQVIVTNLVYVAGSEIFENFLQ